jgi:hypothetical protein
MKTERAAPKAFRNGLGLAIVKHAAQLRRPRRGGKRVWQRHNDSGGSAGQNVTFL